MSGPAERGIAVRRSFHRAGEMERRQDLIRATLDCIAESGLQGATVRQIAARAGVTGGLIRHYFAGKDEMLQAAYREIMTTMAGAAVQAVAAGKDTPRERLRNFVVANLSPPVTDPRTISLWAAFVSHVRSDSAFARIHREAYLGFLDTLEPLIAVFLDECGQKATQARCRDHAIAINGLIDGLWLEATLAGDLFAEGALPRIALSAVEAILGASLERDV